MNHSESDAPWARVKPWMAENHWPPVIALVGDATQTGPFFSQLAASILCVHRQHDGRACGTCVSCRWIQSGTHPDDERLDSLGRALQIDDVRALTQKLSVAPVMASHRVVRLPDLAWASRSAVNALLKALEEPFSPTVFLFATPAWHRLLPTLKSRSQRLSFSASNGSMGLVEQNFLSNFFKFLKCDISTVEWLKIIKAMETDHPGGMFRNLDTCFKVVMRALLGGNWEGDPHPCVSFLVKKLSLDFYSGWYMRWQQSWVYKREHPQWNMTFSDVHLFLALRDFGLQQPER